MTGRDGPDGIKRDERAAGRGGLTAAAGFSLRLTAYAVQLVQHRLRGTLSIGVLHPAGGSARAPDGGVVSVMTSDVARLSNAVILAIIISETTSNTASAAVVVPIIIPVAMAAGINPFVPALAATFAASFGFMLPVSTPQNASVYGSGAVKITTMIRSGITFDIAGALLIIILLPLMVSLLGLGG